MRLEEQNWLSNREFEPVYARPHEQEWRRKVPGGYMDVRYRDAMEKLHPWTVMLVMGDDPDDAPDTNMWMSVQRQGSSLVETVNVAFEAMTAGMWPSSQDIWKTFREIIEHGRRKKGVACHAN